MHDHLGGFVLLWILNRQSQNEGRAGGQYYKYEFTVEPTLVSEVVDTLDGVSLPNRICSQL
jgi:cell division control protein 6